MNRREIRRMLRDSIANMERVLPELPTAQYITYQVLLGQYMDFCPCGRFHSPLSINGATKRCYKFWKMFEEEATGFGGWISDSDGDFCDVCFNLPEDNKYIKEVNATKFFNEYGTVKSEA